MMHKSVSDDEWNALYIVENAISYTPRYPYDPVVRWSFVNFRNDFVNKPKMLDVGCGGGRHSIFLAELGCIVSAIDYSSGAIDIANLWAEEKNIYLDTRVVSATLIPYENDTFVGVISCGVLCYLNLEDLRSTVNEMYRVLRPGGKIFVATRSNKDSRYITGNKTTENYAVVTGDESVPWQVELGMEMTFLKQEDIKDIFIDFKELNIEQHIYTMCDRKYVEDDWIITAIK